jgi:hypothetical protein
MKNKLKMKFYNWRTGDKIESVAQPIAGAIDKVLKTNIKGCSACKSKAWLNGE